MNISLTRLVLVALATGSGGCFLVDPDITSVKFDLPERSYAFDTAQSGWNLPPATLPSLACATDAECCAVADMAGVGCARVTCDGATATCALTVTVETPPQTINLKEQVPQLSAFDSQSAIDVTINQIKYDVRPNTMTVPLPPVELFVAPDGTTSTSGAGATRFGTVPSTPAMTEVKDGLVVLDAAGQQAFVGLAHNFGTPFVFLARTTVVVPGGTPLPMGALAITVKGQLSAKAGF